MAYNIFAPILFACVFAGTAALFTVLGLFKPAATSTGKVRWVAFVTMLFVLGVTNSIVAQRQGISDPAGPLAKRAAYGLRAGEAIALGAASVTVSLSIFTDMGARLMMPILTTAIGVLLALGCLVRNISFDMWFYWMWSAIVYLFLALALWLIDHADWIPNMILRDGERLPKFNAWPWRLAHCIAPVPFIVLWTIDFDTTTTFSDTVSFILHGVFQAVIGIVVCLNYYMAKSVDLQEYTPLDQSTAARINAQMGDSKSGKPTFL